MDPRSGYATQGDAAQFELIFRDHADAILRFFLRRTGDWAAAEDLRSIVFYEAWRRWPEVDLTGRDALPWLYGVATNVLRNHLRSKRRYESAMRRLPLPAAATDDGDEIAERVDASVRAQLALVAVAQLPPGERDVVVLCLAQDMTYAAAASQLGLPVGTVRSRLSRARARLGRSGTS